MPGPKSNLFIPLGSGISTDIDDHLLPVGKSLDTVNMNVFETGNLRKRFGSTQRSALLVSGSALPQTWQLGRHRGADLSVSSPAQIPMGVYSPQDNRWSDPTATPSLVSLLTRRGTIVNTLTKLTSSGGARPMIAIGGGYTWVLYDATVAFSTTLRLDVFDSTTNHLVTTIPVTSPVGAAVNYAIAFCNGYAVAAVAGTSNVSLTAVLASTLAVTTTTLVTTMSDSGFDILVKDATTVSVVYADNASLAAALDFVPSTLAITAWQPLSATAATIPVDRFVCWCNDLGVSGKIAIATAGSVNGIRMQWDIPTTGATRQAVSTYVMDAASTGAELIMTAHTTGATATGAFQILYSQAGTLAIDNLTKMAVRNSAGAITGGTVIFRTVKVISKTWTIGGDFFVAVGHQSALYGNSYVLLIPPTATIAASGYVPAPQSQFAIGSSGALTWIASATGYAPAVLATGATSTFITAIQYIQRIGSSTNSNRYGIELVSFFHTGGAAAAQSFSTGPPVEMADSTIVPGGTVAQFDGGAYYEMGYSQTPEGGSLVPSNMGGGMTSSVKYWYVFVFAYQDVSGRLWRSAPSVIQSVTMGAADNGVTIQVPMVRITGRQSEVVEIYRGAANDSNLLQFVGSVKSTVVNDYTAFVDATSDASLASGEFLYTNGGILPNEIIPGSSFVFTFQNRIWFISSDDPTEIWFSDQISPKNGPRFNSQNVVRIADGHGPVYACGVIDDKVVALKEDAIYSWNGDGPDGAGGGGYTPATIVALGVGTTQPRSVLSIPDGVIFGSSARRPGMQMITRALALAKSPAPVGSIAAPFGEAVLRYTNETIVSAVLMAEQSQARFYCYSGIVLVYDLVTGTWTTSLLGATQIVSAVNTGNGALIAATNGALLLIEDTTGATYADNGVSYISRVGTPWIQVDGIAGFERIMQIIGVGRTIGAHTLQVDMYINFDDTNIVATKTFAMTTANANKWNWEWIPRIQRMSAVRFVLSETSAAAGFQCNGMTALLGLKQKLDRQPTSTRGP